MKSKAGYIVASPHGYGVLTYVNNEGAHIVHQNGKRVYCTIPEIKELDADVVRALLRQESFRRFTQSIHEIRVVYPD